MDLGNIHLNMLIKYDQFTGLSISTKAEVMEDLVAITKYAFGQDVVVEQGSEWYTFLDCLAEYLVDGTKLSQNLYGALSYINASGVVLDYLASMAGISRLENESDTMLRTRYQLALYKNSTGTLNAIKSQLLSLKLKNSDGSEQVVKGVSLKENTTNTTSYGIEGHSINVVVDYDRETNTEYGNANDDTIGNLIFNYKSLGCGTTAISGPVQKSIKISDTSQIPPIEYVINFNKAQAKTYDIKIKINVINTQDFTSTMQKELVDAISAELIGSEDHPECLEKEATVGRAITSSNVYKLVNGCINRSNGELDPMVDLISILYDTTGYANLFTMVFTYYQYLDIGHITVSFYDMKNTDAISDDGTPIATYVDGELQ